MHADKNDAHFQMGNHAPTHPYLHPRPRAHTQFSIRLKLCKPIVAPKYLLSNGRINTMFFRWVVRRNILLLCYFFLFLSFGELFYNPAPPIHLRIFEYILNRCTCLMPKRICKHVWVNTMFCYWVAQFTRLLLFFFQENCNTICSDDYSFQTKNAMAQLSEKETSFELIEVLCPYLLLD